MRLIPPLMVLFCSTMTASAAAQGAPAARVCSPANGQHTSIAAVSSDPKSWLGKCVTVQGIYSNERLYADIDAIYGVSNASIGGYVDGRGSMDGFWKGEFAGRVTDCASAQADLDTGLLRSPGISLDDRVLGCKTPEGAFLVFLSPRGLEPVSITRRLRAEAGPSGGDLVPTPKDWEHRKDVVGFAAQIEIALHSSTSSMLADLIGNAYQAEQVMHGPDTAFTKLKEVSRTSQVEVFVRDGSSSDRFSSEACFCLTNDCRKLWPIAQRDADNQVSRPYACVRVDGSRKAGAWTYALDASQDFDGLPER